MARWAAAVLVLGLVAVACGGEDEDPSPPPPTVDTTIESTTTTSRPPATVTTTPRPPRTTTTVAADLGPGGARIQGSVVGPQGLVQGASVRVERFVGDDVASTDLVAGDGRFTLPAIRGGSYRVRAWKAPDLALMPPEVFFLAADEVKNVELRLTRVSDQTVRIERDVTNLPAEEPFTVTVQVYAGRVDDQGTVQGVSKPGLAVQVTVGAGLSLLGSDRATTDASGRASFRLRCTAPGPVAADVVVDGNRQSLGLPNCPG